MNLVDHTWLIEMSVQGSPSNTGVATRMIKSYSYKGRVLKAAYKSLLKQTSKVPDDVLN